jgi:hypothetical protein
LNIVTQSAEDPLAAIPGALVVRAQDDLEFALRLLHRDTRDDALYELDLGLTEEEHGALSARIDEVAGMSFQTAIEKLRDAGVTQLG